MVSIDRLEKRITKLKGLVSGAQVKDAPTMRKIRKTLKRVQRKRRRFLAVAARLVAGQKNKEKDAGEKAAGQAAS